MAVQFFPAQVSDVEYYHGVLDHVLNPNAEDCHDACGWVQDVDDLVSYINTHDDAVCKKYSRAIADEAKWSKIRNYLQTMQGSGKDATQILSAVNKMKPISVAEPKPESLWDFAWSLPTWVYKMWAGSAQPEVFTTSGMKLICSPSFFYDSTGAFLKALEEQLNDPTWKRVASSPDARSHFRRKDAEALVQANIQISPAYLYNLNNFLSTSIQEFITKSNPLYLAILQGDLKKIESLVHITQYRIPVFSHTPLGIAVLSGNLDVVKALVDSSLFDLDEKDGKENTPVKLAAQTGHLPILKYLLERGAKPHFSRMVDHLLGAKLLLEKKAEIPIQLLRDLRGNNSARCKRFLRLFKDSIPADAISEVNERFNVTSLSHAGHKKGEVELKRKDQDGFSKMNLEGSRYQINCEIMSRIWKEFCQSHPRDIPVGFETWLGDALMDAAEWSILGEEGLFERHQRGDLTIIPVKVEYKGGNGHVVGILLLKDYLCIFDGGPKRKSSGNAIFHGKFQPNLMKEEIIKKIMARKNSDEHQKFFYKELPRLIGLNADRDEDKYFLRRLRDYFSSLKQLAGNCGWFNINYLATIALSQQLYNNRDKNDAILGEKYGESEQVEQIIHKAWDISAELYKFQQAWLLRNYLFSETREKYELCHDFIKGILKSNWDVWMGNFSQVTKNILYQCEKRYLDLLSEKDRSIYKADKVTYLVKAQEQNELYPSILSLKKNRLR